MSRSFSAKLENVSKVPNQYRTLRLGQMEHRDTVLNLVTPLNFIHRNHFHGLERDTELYFSVPHARVNVYTCDAFSDLCLSVAGRGARGWNILVRRCGGGVRRKLGRKCHSLSRAATSYFYTNIILSQQSSASVIYTVQH